MKELYPFLSIIFLISVGVSQNKVNLNNLIKYGDKYFKENDDIPYDGVVFDMSKETGNKTLQFIMVLYHTGAHVINIASKACKPRTVKLHERLCRLPEL